MALSAESICFRGLSLANAIAHLISHGKYVKELRRGMTNDSRVTRQNGWNIWIMQTIFVMQDSDIFPTDFLVSVHDLYSAYNC